MLYLILGEVSLGATTVVWYVVVCIVLLFMHVWCLLLWSYCYCCHHQYKWYMVRDVIVCCPLHLQISWYTEWEIMIIIYCQFKCDLKSDSTCMMLYVNTPRHQPSVAMHCFIHRWTPLVHRVNFTDKKCQIFNNTIYGQIIHYSEIY